LQVSYVGYSHKEVSFQTGKDTLLTVALEASAGLDEVTVYGAQVKRFNLAHLSNKEMLTIPSLGGKPDVLKAMQLMPGIQGQMEGTSLMLVRGGSPGENLYLIDNIPLIYVNHLGGFISVFNPDMINNIDIYKGGFPARYGGKLSSVVDMTQREGNRSQTRGSLSLGVTDASFTVEGPIKNEKASFIVTGRKTMIEPLMILASGLSGGGDYFVFYGFHDINAKFSYKPDPRNSFSLNLYQGDDYIRYWSKKNEKISDKNYLLNIWGNWLASARWSRVVSMRLFADHTFSYTRYRYSVGQYFYTIDKNDTTRFEKNNCSTVQDYSLRSDWKYKVSNYWSVDFGGKLTRLVYQPNRFEQSNLESRSAETIGAFENSLYASNHFSLFGRLEADLGLRAVHYSVPGFTDYSLEPRLNLNWELNPRHTLNLSAQRVKQYAHLVLTSGAILTNEVWIPSDQSVAPAVSEQYSAGWRGHFAGGLFETELDLYYKTLHNLTAYREGYTSLMGDGSWRNKIESGGQGISTGVEFLLRKTRGKWTGFASYALSHTTRQFPGINKGEAYVWEYDRPHSISLSLARELSPKWSFSAVWVYQSGLPYTPVMGRQLGIDGEECLLYGARNSSRMKNYHRLDLGFTCKKTTRRGNRAEWNFSVYNAYCRRNPNSYYYNTTSDPYFTGPWSYDGKTYQPLKMYQISFFPIIPTVSYKVYFERDKNKPRLGLKQRIRNYLYYEN